MTTTVKIDTAAHAVKLTMKQAGVEKELEIGPYSSHVIFIYSDIVVTGIEELEAPAGTDMGDAIAHTLSNS